MVIRVNMKRIGEKRSSTGNFDGALQVKDFETGEVMAEFETTSSGRVTLGMRRTRGNIPVLEDPREVFEILKRAAINFQGKLEIGGGSQTFEEFLKFQTRASGKPLHVCKSGAEKCVRAMENAEAIAKALLSAAWPSASLDDLFALKGVSDRDWLVCQNILGLQLPSNAMGTNSIWPHLSAFLRGVAIKVGSRDPLTPHRIVEAMISSGMSEERFGVYANPDGDHSVGGAVIGSSDVGIAFGNVNSLRGYIGNPRVQGQGPGVSKIMIPGHMVDEVVDNYPKWEPFFIASIDGNNCGASCICASGIWIARRGRELAALLAKTFGDWEPRSVYDSEAKLAAFAGSNAAQGYWDQHIAPLLSHSVIESMTATKDRVVAERLCSYMRPVVLFCTEPAHPAATGLELPFHMVTVVECPDSDLITRCGKTLIASVVTDGDLDDVCLRAARQARHIDQVNNNEATTVLHMGREHGGNSLRHVCQNFGERRHWMPTVVEDDQAEVA